MPRLPKVALSVLAGLIMAASIVGFAVYKRFQPDELERVLPWGTTIDMGVFPEYQKAISESNGFAVFEGLPHERSEPGLYKAELRSRDHFESHGFYFYSDQLDITQSDSRKIVRTLNIEGAASEWMGPKLCGGYHPDYLLMWEDSGGELQFEIHICFGCHEMRLYGGRKALYVDYPEKTYIALKGGLGEYATSQATNG